MPNRILKESIKSSPQIDALSWFEEVVFYRLMVSADDYGCMDGRTVLLRNELFPTKDTVTKKAVEDAIAHLVSVGLLCKYTVNGMPYLFFPTWEKHQRIRNKHRKYPEPSFDSKSLSNDGQMTASCQSESNPIQVESEIESKGKGVQRFAPPTPAEAAEYHAEKGFSFSLEAWMSYYETNGWMVNGRKMKDWKASMRYWQTKEANRPQPKEQPKSFAQMWREMQNDES
jgi:hypothetical protein